MSTNGQHFENPIGLSRRAAAKALSISESTLDAWTKDKLLPHVRIGGRVLYPRLKLEAWLNQQSEGGTK